MVQIKIEKSKKKSIFWCKILHRFQRFFRFLFTETEKLRKIKKSKNISLMVGSHISSKLGNNGQSTVSPKKYPKICNPCIFPAEHDTGVSLPLFNARGFGDIYHPPKVAFFDALSNGYCYIRYFSTSFFLQAILWFSHSFLHFPSFLCMVTQFWARIWFSRRILHRL